MNLFQNPFFIIGVSTRDSKQSIVDACDAKSLTVDSDLCTRSRAVLTQPRNRLSAELAWLPGLSPARALGLIERFEKDPKNFLLLAEVLNPLCKCNVMTTYLEYCKPKDESLIINVLMALAQSFDQIDFTNLMSVINEDRQIAKIPVIQDVESIKQEMQGRREHIIGIMKDSLNNVKAPDNVLTEIITKTTADGKLHPPILIEELTDKYQIEVQKYLDQLVAQIRNVVSNIEKKPKTFECQMPNLYKYLKAWDQIAQPIQLIHQSKWLDDTHSKELAHDMRNLAITMANTYELHSEAKQVSEVVAEIFKELPQFAERVAEDITVLDGLIEQKRKSVEEERKWRDECSLEVDIGAFLSKRRLSIAPEFIRYGKEQMACSEITKTRWGGIITDGRYSSTILIGNNRTSFHIKLADKNIFTMIVGKLFKVIGHRLFTEALQKISAGQYITYGSSKVNSVEITKEGMNLTILMLSGPHSSKFYPWEKLRIGNGNGSFTVKSDDNEASAELSYIDDDNTHILEALVRFLWKDGNYQKLRRGEFA